MAEEDVRSDGPEEGGGSAEEPKDEEDDRSEDLDDILANMGA